MPTQNFHPVLLSAVFLVSLSSIAFEVLLARVFAISQWNHMVFMVISIALLGFAAAGTFLSLAAHRKHRLDAPLGITTVSTLSLAYPAAASVAFLVVNRLPLDYFRLAVEPIQAVYLLITYLLLVAPFFMAGLVISSAYNLIPEKTGTVYFISMTGSACGALIPAVLLPHMNEGTLVIITAMLPMLTVFPALRLSPGAGEPLSVYIFSRMRLLVWAVTIGGSAAALVLLAPQATAVRMSPYKAMAQMLQLPDSRVVETRKSLTGNTTIVASPHIRFAPGLSLKFSGGLPQQKAVYRDGDTQLVLYEDARLQEDRFAAFTLSYSAYALAVSPSNVLIVQNGGGLAMACARLAGIERITLAEENAEMARIAAAHYGFALVDPQTPRHLLSRTDEKYDVIHVENWGTSLPGAATLSQEYLLTIDALTSYIERLSDRGVIIVSRRLLLPPSDLLRLWGTAVEALRAAGFLNPERHLAVLRSWDTYVLLITRKPLRGAEALFAFAERLNFDWVYLTGLSPGHGNKYYIFEKPYHSLAVERLSDAYQDKREGAFFNSYLLDISPQSDDRPFPYRFLKWHRLADLYRTTGSRMNTLLLSGEIVIAAVMLTAAVLSAAMLIIPSFWPQRSVRRPRVSAIVFFLSVGAGFMLVELYFIKQFTLFLGDPVVSFITILSGVLVFSGLGGYLSQKLAGRSLVGVLIVLVLVLLLLGPLAERLSKTALTWTPLQSYLLALSWLAVPGFLVGIPFPLAMRQYLQTPGERSYAWAANGCTSVLASIAAAQLAISMGLSSILTWGTAAYFVALICAAVMHRTAGSLVNSSVDGVF